MKFIFIFIIFINSLNAMNCSDYQDFKIYKEHYYSVSVHKLTFENAKKIAENNGGFLAIPNDELENDFIKDLMGGGSVAWIGIYDPNKRQNYCYYGTRCFADSTRFRDIKGNSLFYKNFATNQPDNLVKKYDVVDGKEMVAPLGEHWVAMNGNNGKWSDFGNHAHEYNSPVKYKAVFEFENLNECKPLSDDDGIQDYTGLFCNTQIYDTKIDELKQAKTFSCQKDKYGKDYCPSALAQCGKYWDYDDGYSIRKTRTVVDYKSKVQEEVTTKPTLEGSKTWINWECATCPWFPTDYIRQAIQYAGGTASRTCSAYGWRETHRGYVNDSSQTLVASRDDGARWNVPPGTCIVACTKFDFCTHSASNAMQSTIKNRWKPHLYLRSSKACSKWRWSPAGKHHAGHYYCADSGGQQFVKCPSSYTKVTDEQGYAYCSKQIMTCPSGYQPSGSECKKTLDYTYYEYKCYSDTSSQGYDYTPSQSTGYSQSPPKDNCKRQKFLCKANEKRPCVWVDNQWQCSPFPCFGEDDTQDLDTKVGSSDKKNDGWSEDGKCSGQIYIFNGKSNKCRSSDNLGGLTGGGCCDKDKVFLGLVKCKANEKLLAKQRKEKETHYVGNFCSKKLKLFGRTVGCITKSDSYCTFSSSLARIIMEQGRPQLDISWGSPENPTCRGFTPQEFQKLDFSKIDLTEFTKDIQDDIKKDTMQGLGTYVKDKVKTFYDEGVD